MVPSFWWDPREDHAYRTSANASWVHLARQADIVIFNTGHHHHRRDPTFEKYELTVRNVLQALTTNFKGSHIIFRTSNWGHAGCPSIHTPFQDVSAVLNHMKDDRHFWRRVIQSEFIWLRIAKEMGMGHQFIVNNSSMTVLRGEAHKDMQQFSPEKGNKRYEDCLHNCLPGVSDYWNWQVYHTLMSLDLPAASREVGFICEHHYNC